MQLREKSPRFAGVDENQIVIQGTHTHSGPDAFDLHLKRSAEEEHYYQLLIDGISNAIIEGKKE